MVYDVGSVVSMVTRDAKLPMFQIFQAWRRRSMKMKLSRSGSQINTFFDVPELGTRHLPFNLFTLSTFPLNLNATNDCVNVFKHYGQ